MKPLPRLVSQTNTLPIGLNRISWKPLFEQMLCRLTSLPIGLNRISWKRVGWVKVLRALDIPLPIGLNRALKAVNPFKN